MRRHLAQGPGTWNNDDDCQGNYFLELEDTLYKGYCLTQFDNNGNNIRIMPCQKTVGQLWTLNYENLQLGSSTTIRNVASQLQTSRCLQVIQGHGFFAYCTGRDPDIHYLWWCR